MPDESKRRIEQTATPIHTPQPLPPALDASVELSPAAPLQRAQSGASRLSPADVIRLQRTVGNKQVTELLAQRLSAPAQVNQRTGNQPTRLIQAQWSVDELVKTNRSNWRILIGLMNMEEMAARQHLRALAGVTDSAQQLHGMLQSIPNALHLYSALKLLGGPAQLKAMPALFEGMGFSSIVELFHLGGDKDALLGLAQTIKPPRLQELLRATTGDKRAITVRDAVALAGSIDELQRVIPLSQDCAKLLTLQKKLGHAELLTFVTIAKDADTLIDLLAIGDAATIKSQMQLQPKADFATLKPLVIKGEITKGARVDPYRIRFTQATCSGVGEGYTVDNNINRLKTQPNWDIPGAAIRVFQKRTAMNNWGSSNRDFGVGDPRNLEDDQVYTLDNRRLVAYQRAGRQIPQPQFVPDNVAKQERWKFTTANGGQSIRIT